MVHSRELRSPLAAESVHLVAAYQQLLDFVNDMVSIHAPDGTYLWASSAYERLLGYTLDELSKIPPVLLTHPDDLQRTHNEAHQQALRGETVQHIEYRIRKKDGSYLWVESFAFPVLDEGGRVFQLVSMTRDISQRVNEREELVHHRARSETFEREHELSDLKSKLMRTITHEFRTPLAVIHSALEMIERYYDRYDVVRRADLLHTARTQIAYLTEMLDELSSAVRDLAHQDLFVPSLLDLRQLCQVYIDSLGATIGGKHRLDLRSDDAEVPIIGDKKLLGLVISNLLSNAIKFSPEGQTISVELSHEDDVAMLRVIDCGIGISPENLERVFEPFFRAENAEHIRGTGLGLTIVRDAVLRHGGSISIESEVNGGTKVTVLLPCLPPPRLQA